ncbi:putative serine/threonine-protein kinase [Canna indica]|uniref:Serine/threonine-protein kinase n=1 Tax=Canna indica TaxID=4628 RepID=A0AAQ3KAX7_9LILI|nr:putative serine/threonine-protein kinase [Canna indica]
MPSNYSSPILNDELSKRTIIFGLHKWVIIGIGLGTAFVLLLFLIALWFASKRNITPSVHHQKVIRTTSIPNISKEIQVIHIEPDANLPR